jgi:hypothetical protein
MRASLGMALLVTLVGAARASGQALDERMVPAGRVRLEAHTRFTGWDSRFGLLPDGATRQEALGEDLTDPTSVSLFPGIASLTSSLEAITGTAGYTPVLGSTRALVTQDITRIDWGAHLGVTDWLTIGAVLPWMRTRTALEVVFRPDTLAGDLGLNPAVADPGTVAEFLFGVDDAVLAAQARASQECAAAPGGPGCLDAQALAARAATFQSRVGGAYGASALFPVTGSAMAGALAQAAAALDADLTAAGLAGIGAPMAFAADRLQPAEFAGIPALSASGIDAAAGLEDFKGLWQAGDVEVSASLRLLEGEKGDSAASRSTLTYRVLAGALVRLPTGTIDHPDIVLDVGTGQGQTDWEGWVSGALTAWGRVGLAAGARYGVQMPRTLVRRVAPPEQLLAPASTRSLVRWDPASYWAIEAAPALWLTEELAITGEYHLWRKGRDFYGLATVPPPTGLDPADLAAESALTLHQVGLTLRYDTMARWRRDGTTRPLQLYGRWLHAIDGSGGQVPVTTRLEFGLRLFKRFWGRR